MLSYFSKGCDDEMAVHVEPRHVVYLTECDSSSGQARSAIL